MRHRTKKQIIIATIFFGFWISLGSLVAFLRREPPPRPTPSPRQGRPIEVVSVKPLPTAPDRADLIGLLRNPNPDAGAARVDYEFQVRSDGAIRKTVSGRTFLLPGRQKYVAAFHEEIPAGNVTVTMEVTVPEWTFVGEGFAPPPLVPVNWTTRMKPGNPALTEVKGLLANEGNVDYQHVEVTTVGFDTQRQVIGISHTFLGSFQALERREFTAQWPVVAEDQGVTIEVYPDVNIFLLGAVQPREGGLETRDLPNAPLPPAAP